MRLRAHVGEVLQTADEHSLQEILELLFYVDVLSTGRGPMITKPTFSRNWENFPSVVKKDSAATR